MSTASLTIAHRPQTFADVAGQDTIKAILSRAAQEDRIAPAYLFSGTRGVGKTTIARIFAKALNCATAPAAEPCNVCEHCRKITQGMHVDVVEIDGASNRGIDDARRLRESIGYAAMEGRYRVFIIDEAHMLTRDAFNALLKTLEEPPRGVTFIMATTEPHKFPVTIISRCQHYIFKRLGEQEIEAHLVKILGLEARPYEPQAVKLIARRAAGSVRDSMSLLGQVLALGHERLEEQAVRSILGLAGQELFFKVMEALKAQDVLAVSSVIRSILDQGVDIGFFLRELAATWRNLFMLKQAGEAALPLLDLPQDEAAQWLAWTPEFELAHVHACWQLTLEGQRRVLTSLEPAMALELLLLNLAFLPKLLNMEQLSRGAAAAPASQAPQGSQGSHGPQAAHGGQGAQGGVQGGRPVQGTGGPGGPRNPFDAAAGAVNRSGGLPDAPTAPGRTPDSTPDAAPRAGQGSREEPPHRRARAALQAEQIGQTRQTGQAERTGQMGQAGQAGQAEEARQPEQARKAPGITEPAFPAAPEHGADAFSAPQGGDASMQDGPPADYDMGPPPDLPPELGGAVAEIGPQPDPERSADTHAGHDAEPSVMPDPAWAAAPGQVSAPGQASAPGTWEGFLAFCRERNGEGGSVAHALRLADGEVREGVLNITAMSATQYEKLGDATVQSALSGRVREYFGEGTRVAVREPLNRVRPPAEMREEVESHPTAVLLREELGATLAFFRHKDDPSTR
ncbi:DNA polymerase III subunit gamma/tau [Desulfovibrio psychrotolerans]|uniref:DNA polymerase III subunit gamma/tau n=1 Tax=Desulfovibrio psychrotolerans TaxID=415242 RepID=A0A7J0BU27_9BACT|nr:DNA polymerase III subunit gamma/tau [Desulfovibrio psychrotolerans]GFM36484.1 hypothetical protein DSM19430T_11680 [Desulfovibrio psychrotolerans]